ncbi:hypothetical protein OCU04_002519 [Sclerotinia nivalis]|uniref:Uncharacterized protein n=1 Tax=Sclerotinia nivalis TaxID=352851 RepID=A0A9X0AUR5_9HELO|nr:hypothetical protein OCU04_002519 [Sclerotinia nivalis]
MCKRQWASFTHCSDIRTAEYRCKHNPIGQPFENCKTRSFKQPPRSYFAKGGIIRHPDPEMMLFQGRCVDWGAQVKKDAYTGFLKVCGGHVFLINEPTWIMCSNDWKDAIHNTHGHELVAELGLKDHIINSRDMSESNVERAVFEELMRSVRSVESSKAVLTKDKAEEAAPKVRHIEPIEMIVVAAGLPMLPGKTIYNLLTMLKNHPDFPQELIQEHGVFEVQLDSLPPNLLSILHETVCTQLPTVADTIREAYQRGVHKRIDYDYSVYTEGIDDGRNLNLGIPLITTCANKDGNEESLDPIIETSGGEESEEDPVEISD